MKASKLTAALLGVAGALASLDARAQDSAAAETLFQKAHKAFEEKRYAEACPAFAESYRLDPLSGALLALAACYEADGKLASAWSKYVEVVALAEREGKKERADAARARSNELKPKLAQLIIVVAAQTAATQGLSVKRDGTEVGAPSFDIAVPVDQGSHTIEVNAPGHQPFVQQITVHDGATVTVSIPALVPGSNAPAGGERPEEPSSGGKSILPIVGWTSIGVGAVAIGVGAVFGAKALSKKSDSDLNCTPTDHCNAAGVLARTDAVNAGNTSTALFIVGGVLAAGGVVLVLVGSSSGSNADAKPTARLAPAIGHDGGGLSFAGRF